MELKIGTRKSLLAQEQADYVIKIIENKFNIKAEKLLIETTGDKILDITLDKIGGKGLFVKDIEKAMLEKRADIAVHSMKDVPFELPEGFEIAAMPCREDVRDAFISLKGERFLELKPGAKIGTSSARRAALLKDIRSDIEVVPIRGNVQTRIGKIEKEGLDGIVLAAAGLKRLNLEMLITEYFDPFSFIPAIGQGAIGVEALKGTDSSKLVRELDDIKVRECVEAERSFMRKLNADCHTAIGAFAFIEGDEMTIYGMFYLEGKLKRSRIMGHRKDYTKLGIELAEIILL